MAYGKPAANMGCGPVIAIPTVSLFVVLPLIYFLVQLVFQLVRK